MRIYLVEGCVASLVVRIYLARKMHLAEECLPGGENVGEEEGETTVIVEPPHVNVAFPFHVLHI